MTLVQIVALAMVFKAFFKDKIYSHKFMGFMDLSTEITILIFLMVGHVDYWIGEGNLSRNTWTNIQLYTIYLILFTGLLNLVQIFYNAGVSIRRILQNRKLQVKETKTNVKLEESGKLLNNSKIETVRTNIGTPDIETPEPSNQVKLLKTANISSKI
jgi:hypothetical protein